ncbi:hypothetical protein [Nocardia terpenica]|nr:hypothetical protein [Nocardia terpenica]NQE93646.1 hypothetical protein [Nocardia terpenica]
MNDPPSPTPPYPFFDPAAMARGDHAAFAASSDRLVRHLFDVGLQLYTLRVVFDHLDATPEQVRAAGDGVGMILDELDMLIRDTGSAMLVLTRHDLSTIDGGQHRRRRGKRRHES